MTNQLKKKHKLLVVEDDATNALLVNDMLEYYELDVIMAKNGEEALRFFREIQDIELVLMDIKLPDISGYDLTPILLEVKEVPIIAQTAYAFASDVKNALDAGCVDHIAKPLNEKTLINKIFYYLGDTPPEI